MIITKLLLSLPTEYSYFHSAWDSTAAEHQTFENLTARLTMEETRMTKQHRDEVSEALIAKRFQKKTFPGSKVDSSGSAAKCYFCNEAGHFKRDCPKRLARSNGPSSTNFATGRNDTTGRKGSALVALSEKGISNGTRRKEAFLTLNDAFAVTKGNRNRSLEWYLDSGASDHMTFCKDWFIEYEEFHQPIKVRFGNGSFIYAEGQGNINVLGFNGSTWCERHLLNVLYVPEIHLNLFSQNTVLDKGLVMTADRSKCEFQKNMEMLQPLLFEKKIFLN